MIDPALIPIAVLGCHERLKNAGFESYLVGGCVRDLLLGREPKDWDLTTNAAPEAIQRLFEETFYENQFGTVGIVTGSNDPRHKVVEITPYRREGKYTNNRHPEEVSWARTLSEDLERRDFTINALAFEPSTGELVDLHKGMEALSRRVIETVGDPIRRFEEDALRMLRAIRLAVELDFALDGETLSAIAAASSSLERISRERIRDEFSRILMSPRPMQGVFMAQKLNILRVVAPEIEEGVGVAQNQAHAFDVFEHSLRSLQHAADKNWSLQVRLAALLHDVGKPVTRAWADEKGDWTFYGHEVVGAKIAKRVLSNLKYPRETIEAVTTLVRWHMFFADPDKITLSAVRRLIARVGKDHIDDLISVRVCDRIGTGRPKEHPFRLRKYMSMIEEALRDPVTVQMLRIDGMALLALGERPGPRVGWILHALLEEVLEDPTKNTPENLAERARALQALPDHTLKALGEQGKMRKDKEEKAELQMLRQKYRVS